MPELSIIYNIYNEEANIDSVQKTVDRYAKLPEQVKDIIELVLIDDCSPTPLDGLDYKNLNVVLARVQDDIAWNQPGANNLGIMLASSRRVLRLDADHIPDMSRIQDMAKDTDILGKDMIKQLIRIELDGSERVLPNLYLIDKYTFLQAGGYDEDFSGHYGHDDSMLHHSLRVNRVKYKNEYYATLFRKEDNQLALSSRTLDRSTEHNKKLLGEKAQKPAGCSVADMLNFKWKIVEFNRRK